MLDDLAFPTAGHGMRLRQVSAALEDQAHVVAAALGGSIARGDADEWSDVDVDVYCEPGHERACWSGRHSVLASCGELVIDVDVSDVVPLSSISFFLSGPRLHLTYLSMSAVHSSPQRFLFRDSRLAGICTHADEHHVPARATCVANVGQFIFRLNRAQVAVQRCDAMQLAESRLALLDVYLGAVAASRDKEFFGLRKLNSYLSESEAAWCASLLAECSTLRVDCLVELVNRYMQLIRVEDIDAAVFGLIDELTLSLKAAEDHAS